MDATTRVALVDDFARLRAGTPGTSSLATRPDGDGRRSEVLAGFRALANHGDARLLVGVPYNMDGTETVLTATCRAFADERKRFVIDLILNGVKDRLP